MDDGAGHSAVLALQSLWYLSLHVVEYTACRPPQPGRVSQMCMTPIHACSRPFPSTTTVEIAAWRRAPVLLTKQLHCYTSRQRRHGRLVEKALPSSHCLVLHVTITTTAKIWYTADTGSHTTDTFTANRSVPNHADCQHSRQAGAQEQPRQSKPP